MHKILYVNCWDIINSDKSSDKEKQEALRILEMKKSKCPCCGKMVSVIYFAPYINTKYKTVGYSTFRTVKYQQMSVGSTMICLDCCKKKKHQSIIQNIVGVFIFILLAVIFLSIIDKNELNRNPSMLFLYFAVDFLLSSFIAKAIGLIYCLIHRIKYIL